MTTPILQTTTPGRKLTDAVTLQYPPIDIVRNQGRRTLRVRKTEKPDPNNSHLPPLFFKFANNQCICCTNTFVAVEIHIN